MYATAQFGTPRIGRLARVVLVVARTEASRDLTVEVFHTLAAVAKVGARVCT